MGQTLAVDFLQPVFEVPGAGRFDPAPAPNPASTIVVDLDGTLVKTDTLAESVLQTVRNAPGQLWRLPLWLARGRAGFKASIAAHGGLAVETLPYNETLLSYLQDERESGRRIVLATAAHASIAERVAAHLGLFDGVLASTEACNLKGGTKLAAIEAAVGDRFVYIGDHAADLPIWRRAEGAMLARVNGTAGALRREIAFDREFCREGGGLGDWVAALRVHQWLKNLLLLVPLLTSFGFGEIGRTLNVGLGFAAFCLLASATYIGNDLLDLQSDRLHLRKRNRPFAAGRLPLLRGAAVASTLLPLSFLLAMALPPRFVVALAAYLAITVAYSLALKRYVLIDVLTLGVLYTLRIVAGAAAIGVGVSPWLLAFSLFFFLSLALVKRCSELVSLGRAGRTGASGRDYQVADLAVLWPLGIGAALAAIVVFGLFINVPDTQARYATPNLLWLVSLGLIYWLARLWIKTVRGEMHDDPILFALRDRGSRVVILGIIGLTLAAHWMTIDLLW